MFVFGGGLAESLYARESGAEETWIAFGSVAVLQTLALSVFHTPPTLNSVRLWLRRGILSKITCLFHAGWIKYISGWLTCQTEKMWMRHWRRWAAPYEGLGDEAWGYGLLSGVENEVERSSMKRNAFPSGVQLHSANSILGHLCNMLVSLDLQTF